MAAPSSSTPQWVLWDDLDGDDEDFDVIGGGFAATGGQRRLVDFAVTWMEAHRPGSLG